MALGDFLVDDPFVAIGVPDPASPAFGDPFVGTARQVNRQIAVCVIIVAGIDVTNKVHPHLINVHIINSVQHEAHMELDDRDGRLPIPALHSKILIELGWKGESRVKVFEGWVVGVEHGFGRKQGGRRLWVHCEGVDYLATDVKTQFNNSWGEGAEPGQQEGKKVPFSEVFQEAAKHAGVGAKIHPELGAKSRDFWMQGNESFANLGKRMEGELGGIFRLANNNGEFIKIGEGTGEGLVGICPCKWGDNLIGYRVNILLGKTISGSSGTSYYDTSKATWNSLKEVIKSGDPWQSAQSTRQQPGPSPNQSTGKQQAEGQGTDQANEYADGRIVINGEPSVTPFNMKARIIGVRPGVNGLYNIYGVEHIYSRQGFVTYLDVRLDVTAEGDDNVGTGVMNSFDPPPPPPPVGEPPGQPGAVGT